MNEGESNDTYSICFLATIVALPEFLVDNRQKLFGKLAKFWQSASVKFKLYKLII